MPTTERFTDKGHEAMQNAGKALTQADGWLIDAMLEMRAGSVESATCLKLSQAVHQLRTVLSSWITDGIGDRAIARTALERLTGDVTALKAATCTCHPVVADGKVFHHVDCKAGGR